MPRALSGLNGMLAPELQKGVGTPGREGGNIVAKRIINVVPDRNPLFVTLSDGGVRNGYTVKILNKLHEPREFQLAVRGLEGARLTILGMEGEAAPAIRVSTDDLRELRVMVAPLAVLKGLAGSGTKLP